MALSSIVFKTLEEQRDLVVSLESPSITQCAKHIAFYSAMLDAQTDDPMDDPEDDLEMRTFLMAQLKASVETYQELVNDEL
jgi:hypothetical protein